MEWCFPKIVKYLKHVWEKSKFNLYYLSSDITNTSHLCKEAKALIRVGARHDHPCRRCCDIKTIQHYEMEYVVSWCGCGGLMWAVVSTPTSTETSHVTREAVEARSVQSQCYIITTHTLSLDTCYLITGIRLPHHSSI